MKKNKLTIRHMFLFIILALITIPLLLLYLNHNKYNNTQKPFRKAYLNNTENKLPKFESLSLKGHTFNKGKTTMPFMDVKVFYPFQDNRAALFVTGGRNQKNKVYLYQGNKAFTDIAATLQLGGFDESAYSMNFVDINNNGIKEVIVGYKSGIYAYHYNTDAKQYEPPIKLADVPDTTIPHDISFADTRNNGLQDLFISTFVDFEHFTAAVYHDKTNKRANLFLINNGNGTFTNKAEEAGLGIVENTYLSKFVDFNNNGLPDLILALNTNFGLIYENLGNGTFKQHKLPTEYGFWMGLSVEKLNDTDDAYHIFMSNIGNTFPSSLVRGDLKKDEVFQKDYVLLEQIKDFEFKDVTFQKNLHSNIFGWGVLFSDLNNNGRKDAIITENYINFPLGFHKIFPSKGKVFMQNTDQTFAELHQELGIENPYFGYRALTYDFTGNGFQDVIIGNSDGPVNVFFNKGINK